MFHIFTDVLKEIIAKSVPGAKVLEICEFGDEQLKKKTGNVYKKDKDVKKGMSRIVYVQGWGGMTFRWNMVTIFAKLSQKCDIKNKFCVRKRQK